MCSRHDYFSRKHFQSDSMGDHLDPRSPPSSPLISSFSGCDDLYVYDESGFAPASGTSSSSSSSSMSMPAAVPTPAPLIPFTYDEQPLDPHQENLKLIERPFKRNKKKHGGSRKPAASRPVTKVYSWCHERERKVVVRGLTFRSTELHVDIVQLIPQPDQSIILKRPVCTFISSVRQGQSKDRTGLLARVTVSKQKCPKTKAHPCPCRDNAKRKTWLFVLNKDTGEFGLLDIGQVTRSRRPSANDNRRAPRHKVLLSVATHIFNV
eukprot:TRINITY_DN9279_c0_g1_i1.p1 TRINITY_DN9279_c0_g1~~TRINITY_DN9279_c0_g1_i1.p1  ORF type:complete len:265 (-),score=31.03 TRINITY_DN9279_c0_g1_i1:8-802(-)